ncbi:MAG: hypothetical protein NZU63_04335 [Gemmataceae bacterium]|nr:hypothetical protein [Gemmataceae bacterium]MDW8242488.1 hypothetical protein [Thermogemmata sp.]
MPVTCEPFLRHILHDETLTRGLGDIEARMLIEWITDWAQLLVEAARCEADAWNCIHRLCRRARAIARFVQLWSQPASRGAAAQLAATERFRWPLPNQPLEPPDLMHHILTWENHHPDATDHHP